MWDIAFFNQLKMILGKNPLYWEICIPPAHSCWEKLIGMRVSDSFWLFQALRPAERQANPLLPLPDLHHGFTPPFQAAPGWASSSWQGEVGTCHHWFLFCISYQVPASTPSHDNPVVGKPCQGWEQSPPLPLCSYHAGYPNIKKPVLRQVLCFFGTCWWLTPQSHTSLSGLEKGSAGDTQPHGTAGGGLL